MDLFVRFLVQMSVWSRRPPSKQFVVAAGIAVLVSLVIVGVEKMGWWPEFLTAERLPRRVPRL